jgi:putative hydrolase of HD superfamily
MTRLSKKLTAYAILSPVMSSFGILFRKFRLRAEFFTLSEFGESLSAEGFVYDDSVFSQWQKDKRIPKDRKLLLTIIKLFISRNGIASVKEANILLAAAGQGYLTESEIQSVTKFPALSSSQLVPTKKIVKFMQVVGRSKRILRTGWVREKVTHPESVADHSFRLSVLVMVLADHLGLDKEKLIRMAIIHDLGEVITGDIVWSRGANLNMEKKARKEALERAGMLKVFDLIGQSKDYLQLFEEMIARETQEAKLFWQLDKLEMAIQAMEYEKDDHKKLNEFFVNTSLQIQEPFLKAVLKEVIRSRIRLTNEV